MPESGWCCPCYVCSGNKSSWSLSWHRLPWKLVKTLFKLALQECVLFCWSLIKKYRGWIPTNELLSWHSLETLMTHLASLGAWRTLFNLNFLYLVNKIVEPMWCIGSFLPFPMETWSGLWWGCTSDKWVALLVRWWVALVSRNQESDDVGEVTMAWTWLLLWLGNMLLLGVVCDRLPWKLISNQW